MALFKNPSYTALLKKRKDKEKYKMEKKGRCR